MTIAWTKEYLVSWGREASLKARKIDNGVMFTRRGSSNVSFTIYTSSRSWPFVCEIAFSESMEHSMRLYQYMRQHFKVAEPNAPWYWPRIGLKNFDDEALNMIAHQLGLEFREIVTN